MIDLSKIGFFYQTAKNPCALEMNLRQLKKYYPNSPMIVWEDVSDLCSDICKKHKVEYRKAYRFPNNTQWTISQPVTEIAGGYNYLHRFYTSCLTTLKDADWIMHYEDDVWCAGKIINIPTTEWGGPLVMGNWIHELQSYLINEVGIKTSLSHGACGATLIGRKAFINSYLRLQEINWTKVLEIEPRIQEFSDALISFMLVNGGYECKSWEDCDNAGEDYKVYTKPFIHKIKHWYNHDISELENINSQPVIKHFIEMNQDINV